MKRETVESVLTRGLCTPALKAEVRAMVRESGLVGTPGAFLARVILWHLDKGPGLPTRLELEQATAAWTPAGQHALKILPRRAYDLVEQHRRRLPPVHAEREGPAWE